jgi:CRP/FNR family cyclic AMP-dependent transcriptional regulator
MQPEEVLRILSAATVTQGLEPADLESLLQHATVETVTQGWTVLAEGQRGEALYVVLSGQLKVMLLTLDRRGHPNRVQDIHLNTLRPGDCFGEYSLIDAEPVSASVMAATPAELLKIAGKDFQAVAAHHDRLAKTIYCNLLRILVRRLRKHNQELDLNLDVLE